MGFPHGIDGDIMGDEWDVLINHNMILGVFENGRKMPKILMNDNFQKEKRRKMVMNQWFQGSMPCRKPNRKWEQLVWSSHLAVSAPWNGKQNILCRQKKYVTAVDVPKDMNWSWTGTFPDIISMMPQLLRAGQTSHSPAREDPLVAISGLERTLVAGNCVANQIRNVDWRWFTHLLLALPHYLISSLAIRLS